MGVEEDMPDKRTIEKARRDKALREAVFRGSRLSALPTARDTCGRRLTLRRPCPAS